ncbi:Putative signal peptide protein [Croceitalea dokdonensis DOKDO 023]|uniref:Putative signal peptide protein n=1 Tax=Croceitalea dokdonensis DOKDO 023 TaxID=1300341 RepID=A0A0P7A6A4_9FLAO|nr:Putative signal peptide protein [Croceitalea dokdonensis DOKDO 023]
MYRRLGFSASVDVINQGVGQSANALVDTLVGQAVNAPVIPPPAWSEWTNANYPEDDDLRRQLRRAQREELYTAYGNALLNNNLRDRMSFFWSNHFVTEYGVYDCNSFLYEYVNCLQRNALGNFKTFVSEIGLTSAMLRYLDGAFNNRNRPNENYARELYELFTLGEGVGYTEEDIIEAARALTGYVNRGEVGCTKITFNPERHDTDPKTIMGQTGNWGYEDVIDILFDQRADQIAFYISKKLYMFFVHPDALAAEAQPIINGMAATFLANNFEIAPVLAELLKSEHFFDDTAIGVIIKSPLDLYLNFIKESNFAYTDGTVVNAIDAASMIGQEVFDPVDVAGWQRDRQWINTNYIIGRWLTMEVFLEQFFAANTEQFRQLGIAAAGAAESDPNVVARAIIDKFLPKGLLTDADYERAIVVFREPYEDNNIYETGSWNMMLEDTPSQVYLLLLHLVREPEFQLK